MGGVDMETIGAFSSQHAARLAHLTKRQIEYWDRSGVYSPSLATGRSRQPFGRIYSFRDIVALRTLAILRKDVLLQQLRALGSWLTANHDTP
jgi:DNA-binding transcriptional MerR regulator